MEIYEVYKGSFDNSDDRKSAGHFSDPLACASYLASLPKDDLWVYDVTEWFIGHEGDWPEDAWDYQDNTRADEWLEDFVEYECDGEVNQLYTVGTRVIIPDNYKTHKAQKRLCVIDEFCPEPGREYVILRGVTQRGVSKSDRQKVYCSLNKLNHLEIQS